MPLDSTLDSSSDEELACSAQQGCTDSFEELARRFQVPLLHYLQRWCTKEDAEDLVQDTLIRAFRNLDRYRSAWRVSTWLFTIARRLSINWQRQKRPTGSDAALANVEDQGAQPAEGLAEQDRRRQLWDLAAKVLTESQLTATWLFYVEEMSVKQIAVVLGRSQISAKTILFRARKKMRPALEGLDWKNA